MAEKAAYSVEEVVDSGPLGRTTIYEAIRAGDLIARKYGRSTVILRQDWEEFLGRLPQFAPASVVRYGSRMRS